MRFQSYFNTAVQLINAYDGSMPLAHYLKQYFSQHKKHGSKDRKYITHLCYCYYRLGHALKGLPVEERARVALFICNESISEWVVLFNEDWTGQHNSSLNERVKFIQSVHPFAIADIFPWQDELSGEINTTNFAISHLAQPDLFLRARPGRRDIVVKKLKDQNIQFNEVGGNAVALPNTSKIDSVIELNKEAVVQDYSSQQIQQFFDAVKADHNNSGQPIKIWDCCAASGGKSILAYDSFKNIQLTVSDIRHSIIHNLQQRFKEAGIQKYKSFVADLTSSPAPYALHLQPFDLIICDAPCSGSGTWGRTPEQLYFFSNEKIDHYASLQQKITHAVVPYIKEGGYFLYVTCSVFKKENEAAVDSIQQLNRLNLISKQLLTGYDKKADTMFAALFKK